MTRVVAIDTASEYGSLSLLAEGCEPVEVAMHSPDGFAHVLFGQLEEMLEREGVSIQEIDCFAVAAGPGSFTGVRVAVSAAKGLAESLRRPVVAMSNLKALAWHGSAPVRAAFIDAGRGEVYRGLYGADLEPLCGETAGSLTGWIETLPESGIEIVTAEAGRFAAELEGSRCAGTRVVEAPRFLGATIARIGLGEYLAGRSVDPASVDANYVRRADAELNWKALLRTAGP